MKTDFQPVLGQGFTFTGDWGSVDCQVLTLEPYQTLAYSWGAMGLGSIVTWTLTATAAGTRLRLEQAGFREDQERAYQGAKYGWPRFLEKLDEILKDDV